MFILSKHNSKLASDGIVTMSLMPGDTCVGCKSPCYAKRICKRYPNVVRAWTRNTKLARKNLVEFKTKLMADLWTLKDGTYVRIHTSGDMFSQAYLDMWIAVARLFTNLKFYCYTKSLHLDWTKRPSNLVMIQSLGGEYDHLVDWSLPVAKIMDKVEYGWVNGSNSDLVAARGTKRIALIKH